MIVTKTNQSDYKRFNVSDRFGGVAILLVLGTSSSPKGHRVDTTNEIDSVAILMLSASQTKIDKRLCFIPATFTTKQAISLLREGKQLETSDSFTAKVKAHQGQCLLIPRVGRSPRGFSDTS